MGEGAFVIRASAAAKNQYLISLWFVSFPYMPLA
jgi:hypothetical protein